MPCKDCFNNCPEIPSDQCVKYTGPDIPILGICTGDQLSKVESVILQKLVTTLDGTGINLSTITFNNCSFLSNQFIGKEKTLVNLIQLLVDSNCTLKGLITDLSNGDNFSFSTTCLSTLPANATVNDIIQATINKLCSLSTTVAAFPTTYVKNTDLHSLVTTIIQNYQTSNPNLSGIPANTAVPYFGALSNFDNTGKGLNTYQGWFIANGLNGTPDLRGFKIAGAVRGIPGGSLDPKVDPSIVGPFANIGLGDKYGEAFHKLNMAEIPSHGHPITDQGHDHPIPLYKNQSAGSNNQETLMKNNSNGNQAVTIKSSKSTSSITIGNAGGSQAHENRDATYTAIWIIKL